MEEENYFSDQHIMEQSAAMIQCKDGSKSNGISVLVQCVPGMGAVEILLEYSELKAALSELESDREAMPHLYGLRVREDASTALATVTAERDELASDIVRMKAHLEAAERAAKANGEEAKVMHYGAGTTLTTACALNSRPDMQTSTDWSEVTCAGCQKNRAERSEARAKAMRAALEIYANEK